MHWLIAAVALTPLCAVAQHETHDADATHAVHQGHEAHDAHAAHAAHDAAASAPAPAEHMPMHMMDDRWYSKVFFDELEVADGRAEHARSWDGQAWLGKDLQRLWFKTEGRQTGGVTEHAEVQALYSRAVTPYWDLQAGYRRDFQPSGADWAVLGVRGLTPYFFDVEASLFLGENARTALRLKASHSLLLTQRLVLTPELQIDAFGADDPVQRSGSGISDLEFGLRLRYEIRREIAPYVGLSVRKKLGGAQEFARAFGEQTSDTQWVAGLRFWF